VVLKVTLNTSFVTSRLALLARLTTPCGGGASAAQAIGAARARPKATSWRIDGEDMVGIPLKWCGGQGEVPDRHRSDLYDCSVRRGSRHRTTGVV